MYVLFDVWQNMKVNGSVSLLMACILCACGKATDAEVRLPDVLPHPGNAQVGLAPLNLNGFPYEEDNVPFLGLCVTVYNKGQSVAIGIPARWLENDAFWLRRIPEGNKQFGRWPIIESQEDCQITIPPGINCQFLVSIGLPTDQLDVYPPGLYEVGNDSAGWDSVRIRRMKSGRWIEELDE